MGALLETSGLTVTYGGVHANSEVDVRVDEGRIVGLIGPNGAGKTTFVDAITGFVRPSAGSVRFQGTDVTRLSPDRRARRGLSRTFQSLELFDDLPVADNLLIAAESPRWWSVLADIVHPRRRSPAAAEVERALGLLDIAAVRDVLPADLSHGQRKLVGVARALVGRPRLVVLDEPAAGLDTTESQALGRQLRGLVDGGLTVFLIDHDMGLVLNVCDEIYVLDFGRVIAHGTPAEVRRDPAVIAAYLGEHAGEAQAREGDALAAVEEQVAETRAELAAERPEGERP